jgi:hypothetical protein
VLSRLRGLEVIQVGLCGGIDSLQAAAPCQVRCSGRAKVAASAGGSWRSRGSLEKKRVDKREARHRGWVRGHSPLVGGNLARRLQRGGAPARAAAATRSARTRPLAVPAVDRNPARVVGWQREYQRAEDELDDPRSLALPNWNALSHLATALVARSGGHFVGWGEVVILAACTAARIGEVSGVRRADIDGDAWIWTV